MVLHCWWMCVLVALFFISYSYQSTTAAAASLSVNGSDLVQFNITPVFDQSFYDELDEFSWRIVKCEVVDAVISWLNKALSVRNHSTHSLPYKRSCPHGYITTSSNSRHYQCLHTCSSKAKCGPVQIPQEHLKSCTACDLHGSCWTNQTSSTHGSYFIESHYILYISVLNNTMECRDKGVVLHGETCTQDENTDRPTAGYLNFCPNHCDGRHHYETMIAFVMQEVVSMLGFSKSLLPFFRNQDGSPLMPRGKDGLPRRSATGEYRVDYMISKTREYPEWVTARQMTEPHRVRMITLPNVVLQARLHFGCPSISGMPLEDLSTSKLLWESRLLWGEVMTVSSWGNVRPVLSSITLAFLQDTGWYYPSYDYGFTFHWGRGKGCEFMYQSCLGYAELAKTSGKRPSPFCMPGRHQAVKGCSVDHTYLYTCPFANYTYELPLNNMYWKFSHVFGGNLPSTDYCPLFNSLSSDHVLCTKKTGRTFPEDTIDRISDHAKCIETSKPWKILDRNTNKRYQEQDWGGGCYNVYCNDLNFEIAIGNTRVQCNKTGQLVYVRTFAGNLRYTGEIICPSYDSVCLLHKCKHHCKNGGQCYSKDPEKCYCTPGKYGRKCSHDFHRDDGRHICTHKDLSFPLLWSTKYS